MSMLEGWFQCGRGGVSVGGVVSMLEGWFQCGRGGVSVRGGWC